MRSGYAGCGEPIVSIGDDVYAVTFPSRISAQFAEKLKREWAELMPNTRLIVMDSGAQITRLEPPEPTPIYDALVAERQAS